MRLRFKLPEREFSLLEDNDIQYCAPFDIDMAGNYIENGWFAATRTALTVFLDGEIVRQFHYADIDEIKSEAGVGCGFLYVEKDGEKTVILRYGMRHMSRFSFVARGVRVFVKGGSHLIESTEVENHCPLCGLALRGTRHCPKCDGRSRSIQRLLEVCKPHWKRVAMISLMMLVGAGIMIWQQEFFKNFIDGTLDQYHGDGATPTMVRSLIVFIAVISSIAFFNIFTMYMRFRMTVRLGADITADLRQSLYHKIQELSLAFIDKRKAGEIIARVGHDTAHIQRFINDNVTFLFSNIITMAGAITVMFILNWAFTLLLLAMVPVIIVLNQVFWKFIIRIFRMQRRRYDDISTRLQDVISGIRVVKAYGREASEAERFNELTGRFADVSSRNEKFFFTFYPLLTLLLSLTTCIVIYFGGRLILGGTMTVGELVQFMAYANMLYGPLGWMSFLPRDIITLMTCMERIGDVLDEEPDQVDAEDAVDKRMKGHVVLENVSFGYKSYEPVLENINLEVQPGEMIGLVGPSGAGKSTLINVIMRLYDVDEGKILIDGVDIRDYKQESYHNQIGVVLQEPFLFAGTIYNNIKFSKPDATEEDVILAAKMANAHDFICKTPDGYNTRVGERGFMLSGGERQRLSIARAILNDPSILILDEATSSLDSESEFQIQEALNRLIKGRTTFSIAHRLSTLRNADRIMVIDKHTCMELGTHDELLRKKGIYYNLVMAQLQTHRVRGASA
ncbi:MAG: ABC transporter ATP-binding protein/permease [Oscillospiraceae bacterium]|nr:ABC transporter ATP-binding protein/permease [Oscillospiraceae bacterium]